MDWDLAVVGAGPAGAAAALAALRRRPTARVVLLDRADFPRDKACGDGIAPHVQDVLADLGVPDPAHDYAPVPRLALGYPAGPAVSGRMRRPTKVVPREVFDARLVAAAVDAGAVLRRHRVRRLEQRDDGVVLDGEVAARVVVGADGADSTVRRLSGVRRNDDGHLALAIRGYADADAGPAADPEAPLAQRIVLGHGDWPAYAWSFPIGDGRANVGYGEVLRPGRRTTRERLLQRLDDLLPDTVATGSRWRAHHLPLSSQRPSPTPGRGVLLTGDALSLVNPMTGEGIYYAVLSGAAAGRAAMDPDPCSCYRRLLRSQLGRHLRHTDAATWLARRPAVVPVAIRAARRDRRVFDALVELGLGRGLLGPGTLVRLARGIRRAEEETR